MIGYVTEPEALFEWERLIGLIICSICFCGCVIGLSIGLEEQQKTQEQEMAYTLELNKSSIGNNLERRIMERNMKQMRVNMELIAMSTCTLWSDIRSLELSTGNISGGLKCTK